MQSVAARLDDLLERLDRVNRRMSQAAVVHRSEQELGSFFVTAQRQAEAAIAHAQNVARQTVEGARSEATSILSAARHEVERLMEESNRRFRVTPDALSQVDRAIDAFTQVSAVLTGGLTDLMRMLESLGDGALGAASSGAYAPDGAAEQPSVWQQVPTS
jgi:hypothetical protein